MLSVSTDGAKTWSTPVAVSPASQQNTVMPWVTAGSPGRIGIAWYGSATGEEGGVYGPDATNDATWNLYYAFTEDGLGSSPMFSVNQVNEAGHPIKYGDISTGGLTGTEDRSLGDFFQVQSGPQGQAVISYVDDTSQDRNADFTQGSGESPPEAAGPVMVATQDSGPSLYAGKTVPAGSNAIGSISVTPTQAAKDAFYSSLGQDTAAATDQQVIGSSITQADPGDLTITLTTADANLANDLSVSPTLGGPVANWIVRWAAPDYADPNHVNCTENNGGGVNGVLGTAGGPYSCDGNFFYVGMDSDAGGSPSFYTGSTQAITTTHTKYFAYPETTPITGTIKGGTISWTVPLSDIGSPSAGQGLYSVTAFTDTQLTPSTIPTTGLPNGGEAGDANIPNLIGVSPAFTYFVGGTAGMVPEAAYPSLLALVGIVIIGAGVALRRRRRGLATD